MYSKILCKFREYKKNLCPWLIFKDKIYYSLYALLVIMRTIVMSMLRMRLIILLAFSAHEQYFFSINAAET